MKIQLFKRNLIYRLSTYLLILPFIPAIRPVLHSHSTADLIIFTCGFLLTILLIIYNNNKAYIKITDDKLMIYLMYRHKPEIHHLRAIERIVIKSPRKFTLTTKGFDPLEIRLSRKEQFLFLQVIEEKEISVSTAYRS